MSWEKESEDCKTRTNQIQIINQWDYGTSHKNQQKFIYQLDSIFTKQSLAILSKQEQRLRFIQKYFRKQQLEISTDRIPFLIKYVQKQINHKNIFSQETLTQLLKLIKFLQKIALTQVRTYFKCSQYVNSQICNLISGKNQFNNIVSCLGCIHQIYQQSYYNLQQSASNYLFLDQRYLNNELLLSQLLCGLLNSNHFNVFIASKFIFTQNKVKMIGIKSQLDSKEKYQSKINYCLQYMVPKKLSCQISLEQIPIVRKTKVQNSQMYHVFRINIKQIQQNNLYFISLKCSNSINNFQVSSYQISRGQLRQIDIENAYYRILQNFYRKKDIMVGHQGMSCKKVVKKIKQVKKQSQINNTQLKSYKYSKQLKYSTLIVIYDDRKQDLIEKVKSTFRNKNIFCQAYKINIEKYNTNVKKKYLFWQLGHSCPHETSKKLLSSINKQGYLSFSRPTKRIEINVHDFFSSGKYQQFKRFYANIGLGETQVQISNSENGLNTALKTPIKIYINSLQKCILCFCWFTSEDIRRLSFQK